MASLVARKRADGTTAYRVQWLLGGSRGAPWQSETFDDRKQALKFQAMVEAHHHHWPDGWVKGWGYSPVPAAALEPAPGTLLAEYGQAYVRRLTSASPDTQTRYLVQLATLVGWLTALRDGRPPTLEGFTTDDDHDWINDRRRAGMSPKTIANYHGLLAAICKDAVRKGLISRNPCDGVKLPARQDDLDGDDEKHFLTEDDFALLLACIDADSRDLLTVAVGTGLRFGELTALRVGDLALRGSTPTLSVRRAWKRNGVGEFAVEGEGRFYLGPPKTKESRRKITLAPEVVDALRRACAGKGSDALVFQAPRGGRLDQGHWYFGRWQPAVRTAQKRGLACSPRFHDLRHSHSAWLISAGVPLPVIQKRLGHRSIQITVDVYGGLLLQTHEAADQAISRALSGRRVVPAVDVDS
jgi:integrase